MVRLIEAMNYRSLKCVRQPLDEFHVLVGPNASGKSTYMDVLAFLSRLVNDGLDAAIAERGTFDDLCWNRQGQRFELAIEIVLPEEHRRQLHLFRGGAACFIRYELAVAKDAAGTVRIVDEQVLLAPSWDLTEPGSQESVKVLEEMALPPGNAYALTARNKGIANTVFTRRGNGFWVPLLTPTKASTEYALSPEFFDPERPDEDQYWAVYRPNGKRPIFGSVSEIEFPSTVAMGLLLRDQITRLDVRPDALRLPSAPGQGAGFSANGGNLPWLIEDLKKNKAAQFGDWVRHVRTALPSFEDVRVVERPEDRNRYLLIRYTGGLEVPSWCCSDGTLCLLALTFLAYQSRPGDVYLVEEPESHIHPLNIEPVMQSLGSVYGGQVLVSTHSPTVLALTDVEKVLAFSADSQNGTRIVPGKDHPRLREWKGEISLGTLFASGVLG